MAKLVKVDFPKEKLAITLCYKNEDIIKSLRADSPDPDIPPKIKYIYGDLFFPSAPRGRPYTFCSIVLSSDGKMAFKDNPAGPVVAKNNFLDPEGALADFWVLNALRSLSDCVIIGARTLQAEPFAISHVFDDELSIERQKVMGKPPHPANIVVSFDATDIPLDHTIFDIDPGEQFSVGIATSPNGLDYLQKNFKKPFTVLGPFTHKEEVDGKGVAEALYTTESIPVFITGQDNRPDTELFLYIMKQAKIERLLVESPSFNWHLLENGWLDEFFINYSMVLVGGEITPGTFGAFDAKNHPHAQLVSLGIHKSNFLYSRQKLCYHVNAESDLETLQY